MWEVISDPGLLKIKQEIKIFIEIALENNKFLDAKISKLAIAGGTISSLAGVGAIGVGSYIAGATLVNIVAYGTTGGIFGFFTTATTTTVGTAYVLGSTAAAVTSTAGLTTVTAAAFAFAPLLIGVGIGATVAGIVLGGGYAIHKYYQKKQKYETEKKQTILEGNSITQILKNKMNDLKLEKKNMIEISERNEDRISVVFDKEFQNKIYEVFRSEFSFKDTKIINTEAFIVHVEHGSKLHIKLNPGQKANDNKFKVEATCEIDFPEENLLNEKIESIIGPILESEKEKLF